VIEFLLPGRGEKGLLGNPPATAGFSLHLSFPADRRSDRESRLAAGQMQRLDSGPGRRPARNVDKLVLRNEEAMSPRELFEETIEAHGGRDRWRAVHAIEFALSSGGFAFLSRSQPNALKNLKVALRPHERQTLLGDFPHSGWQGTWTPDRVEIRDPDGALKAERRDPRRHFRGPLNQVYWDKLDILNFAGYALWNYLSFPFLLEEPGVVVTETGAGGASLRLDFVFDPSFPTHSARQSFHLDPSRRLVRHDYTAYVIGAWATAANFCLDCVEAGGLRFYTRRKVYPRLAPSETVVRFPTLVWIAIDDVRVVRNGA
jgi:hypothetical protein